MSTIRILITGGSGFIGTNAMEFYLKKGYAVLNLDIAEPKIASHRQHWKKIDILDGVALTDAVLQFEPTHVLHFAARTDLDETKNIDGYAANTRGVENTIAALRDCRNLQRIIFTSSMYVCYPGYNPRDYNDFAPHTVYGKSKVISEQIVKGHASIPCEWLIIRPTSIWGPWFGHPYKDFFYHVMRRSFVKMQGKTATKTYGFIHNSIAQMDFLLFADRSVVHQKTFYIGDDPGLNINVWADMIAQQLGIRMITVPRFVLQAGALFGDFLGLLGIHFPLQSFRLKNMTTDNVIELLGDMLKVAPKAPYSVEEGVSMTLKWLQSRDPNFRKAR